MPVTDLDFLVGSWDVQHEKLADPFGDSWGPRISFTTRATVWSILDGLGTADETRGVLPDGSGFVGFSLRLYAPQSDEWLIWWASKSRPGILGEPVRGRFHDGVGQFVGQAEHEGRAYWSRFHWVDTESEHPVWEQSFSTDGGRTWGPVNWRMVHTRG